jgi:hypothetical protein
MQEIIDKILQFFTKEIWEPGRADFLGAIMATIISGGFFIFRNRFMKMLRLLREKQVVPKALRHYKKAMDEETLRLNHSWKLEGQSLKELIVPVHVYETDENKRINLIDFFSDYITQNQTPRLLILGDAGSGKSVSMGAIARAVWELERNKMLVPVLITFSEIKYIRTEEDFKKLIVQSLEKHQFGGRKRKNRADAYVAENLYDGNILILIDGLDELEKSVRFESARFINNFFQTHPQIPVIFSSRIAVWKQNPSLFNSLDINTLFVAKFTPLEIRRYLSQWEFTGEKSADRLAMLIQEKSYLRSFAVNPLILTIISFLYAQPKRILPDNRVNFYYECIEALMEKFDNTRLINRANEFETVDKKSILSRLAYQHITDSNETDEDILKSKILDIIEEEMLALSRPVEKREKLLNEIVYNAELLVELPPDAYKFPHRTFMEYFAANYFNEKHKYVELLELYEKDKGKWQETLALFCGINLNQEASDIILNQLKNDFVATSQTSNPDVFVFKALTESARINPSIANAILELAEKHLQHGINREIVEYLGYISINPNWSHNIKAKQILLSLLSENLSSDQFTQILFLVVHLPDPEIKKLVTQHLDKLDIKSMLIIAGTISRELAIRLIENINKDKLEEVFKGLRHAGELDLVFNLMIKSNNKEVQQHAAWTLAVSSNSEVFWTLLESVNLDDLSAADSAKVDRLFNRYTWPKAKLPDNKAGQKAIFLICSLLADHSISQGFENLDFLLVHNIYHSLKYLTNGILHERGYSFNHFYIPFIPHATQSGIITHWKKPTKYSSGDLLVFVCILPYLIVNLIGFSIYRSNNIPLFVMGIGCCIVVGLGVLYLLVDNQNKYTRIRNLSQNVVHISFPLIWFSYVARLRNFRTIISTILLMTGIFITVLVLIPMPFYYKLINIVLVCIATTVEIFGCYLSPLGNIFPNDEVYDLLRK